MADPATTVEAGGTRNPAMLFIMALQFLTVVPALIKRVFTPQEMGRMTAYFPLVGALIGGLLYVANTLLALIFPDWVRAALVLTLWVLFSGALHLDGFLDTCDGLLGGSSPEERLRIMKDERVGAFALAGGLLLFLLKITALAWLPTSSLALLLAPGLGRWSMTLAIYAWPYARPSGLGKEMKEHTRISQIGLATLFAVLLAWLAGQWLGMVSLVTAGLVVWTCAHFAMRRIPGLTGDLYGAFNELVEVTILLVFVAHLP